VFYETQAFIDGKKRDALKYYREYQKADYDGKEGIKALVRHEFTNFDEQKHLTEPLKTFIYECKYE
jgi:hypothetical protein